ncbi:MAG: MarR family transcriptional regulator [Chloroflexales bacterium]
MDDDRFALHAEVFGYIFVLAQQLTKRTDPVLAPLDLTTRQFLLLGVLVRAFPGQQPTLSAAARIYGSSRQNVKQIALQLQERGYLQLLADPADQRMIRLALTDKLAAFDAPPAVARQRQLLAEIFAAFTPEEVAALRDLTRRWVRQLSAEEPS